MGFLCKGNEFLATARYYYRFNKQTKPQEKANEQTKKNKTNKL